MSSQQRGWLGGMGLGAAAATIAFIAGVVVAERRSSIERSLSPIAELFESRQETASRQRQELGTSVVTAVQEHLLVVATGGLLSVVLLAASATPGSSSPAAPRREPGSP